MARHVALQTMAWIVVLMTTAAIKSKVDGYNFSSQTFPFYFPKFPNYREARKYKEDLQGD